MTLTKAIISGSASALSLAKSLLTTPTLTFTTTTGVVTIPLDVESHQQHGDAQVSESLLIATDTDSKTYISDNVAPSSWSWNLSGYIEGLPYAELTNLFTPFVKYHTKLIKEAFKAGTRLTYKDIDCTTYKNVVIQSLDISEMADAKNKKPFTMTLKQINVLNSNLISLTTAEASATPESGSIYGSVKTLDGTTADSAESSSITEKVSSVVSTFLGW